MGGAGRHRHWTWGRAARALGLALGLAWGGAALAQDVALSARDGSLTLEGTLLSYDGAYYRLESRFGLLTLDAQAVICNGPGCPDLSAPFTTLRHKGPAPLTLTLLPALWAEFAQTRGYDLAELERSETRLVLRLTAQGKPLARLVFEPAPAGAARAALAAGGAELALAHQAEAGAHEVLLGFDALVPLAAPGQALPQISTTDLARALAGEARDWAEVGGAEMPLAVYAAAPETALGEAVAARLGRGLAKDAALAEGPAALAAAVAADPYALAFSALSARGSAKALPLTDSCGFPLRPTPLAIKSEDYPLSLPLFLQTGPHRPPRLLAEFLAFAAGPEAAGVVEKAGLVSLAPGRQALSEDGPRLLQALRLAPPDASLADLQGLATEMAASTRLSLTFRFTEGAALDAVSQAQLGQLAALWSAGLLEGQSLALVGFSDGEGGAAANRAAGLKRAESVAAALAAALPDGPAPAVRVLSFGELLPLACDATPGGRRLNRRVEVWLRPALSLPEGG